MYHLTSMLPLLPLKSRVTTHSVSSLTRTSLSLSNLPTLVDSAPTIMAVTLREGLVHHTSFSLINTDANHRAFTKTISRLDSEDVMFWVATKTSKVFLATSPSLLPRRVVFLLQTLVDLSNSSSHPSLDRTKALKVIPPRLPLCPTTITLTRKISTTARRTTLRMVFLLLSLSSSMRRCTSLPVQVERLAL